jgi:hypothetical protein
MINPAYELVAAGEGPPQQVEGSAGPDPGPDDSPRRRGPRRRKDQ